MRFQIFITQYERDTGMLVIYEGDTIEVAMREFNDAVSRSRGEWTNHVFLGQTVLLTDGGIAVREYAGGIQCARDEAAGRPNLPADWEGLPRFVTHNEDSTIDPSGTSLAGHINVTYGALVKAFGKPHKGDGYKVDAEWDLRFADGTIATIYNYKDGRNYCGRSGTAKTHIADWHIGGFPGGEAYRRVCDALGLT